MTNTTIPYGRQSINQGDIDAVIDVLKSDFLTAGPRVPAFEEAVIEYLREGSQDGQALHAVAANSATSVLHIACMALGVGPGDIVWTCANSFAASSNCALYCGAEVDFIDIDPLTLNMSVEDLTERLEAARQTGRLPKVVIPVDFAGRSADIAAIRGLADNFGFSIVEDASHAIGARYLGQKVGAHRFADITVFSFHPVKIITTAEGGLAVTANRALAERMAMLRTHGIVRDPARLAAPDGGPWFYEQLELGYNYRLTELQAALGISQLERIDAFVATRHRLRDRYRKALGGLVHAGAILPPPEDAPNCASALHLYPVQITANGVTRRKVFEHLRAANIGVNVHYIPIYWHPYYRKLGFQRGLCPHAEAYYERAISLPMHADLTDAQLVYVVDQLGLAISSAAVQI